MQLFQKKSSQITLESPGNAFSVRRLHLFASLYILSILAIIGLTAWFVYTNIYQTIGKAESLFMVEGTLQTEPINFKLVNETEEAWNGKHSSSTTSLTHDPFVITSSTSSTLPTTPSTTDTVTPLPLVPNSPQL